MQTPNRYGTPYKESTDDLTYIPIMLVALALIIWFGFQLSKTLNARDGLIAVYTSQEQPVQTAQKIGTSLSALATGTKQLANQGNPNAAQIVKALAQRGINIADPTATAAANPSQSPAKEPAKQPPKK